MCGIAGYYGPDCATRALDKVLQAIDHRGPDGKGMYQEGQVALLHTRLSILDLTEGGAQPMHSSCGRYSVVFNGEIYNHLELRKSFLPQIVFTSSSDTATLLELYRKFGKEMVSHLRGMFAFVIYDKATGDMFGARDRMGIKPFLYTQRECGFAFGSEVGVFRALYGSNLDLETKAIRQLFLYGSIQHPFTIAKGVYALPPAHRFTYSSGELKVEPYWKFPTEIRKDLSLPQAIKVFKSLYEEAIDLRLLSDRKVGLFLSGGLDSCSLLAALSAMGKKSVNTFTIGFTDNHAKFTSEVAAAAAIAKHFGFVNHAKLVHTSGIGEDVKNFLLIIDQPSIDGFNTYLVSRESRTYLTVALSGLGGDELMLGYPRNVNLYNGLNARLKVPAVLSDYWQKERLKGKAVSKSRARLMRYLGNPSNVKLHYWSNRLLATPSAVNGNLHVDLAQDWEEDMEEFYAFDLQGYKGDAFNTLSYYEMRSFMLSQLLRDMDVASMANGIEVRFPMIDHVLVEFLFSLPAEYKFSPEVKSRNFRTSKMTYAESGIKHILAKAYEAVLPKNYLSTPKQGFQLPQNVWFGNALRGEPVTHRPDLAACFTKEFRAKQQAKGQGANWNSETSLYYILSQQFKDN